MTFAVRSVVLLVLACTASVSAANAQVMPEPEQIHGKALSASELPNGTVTVRVVREAIGNNIAGQKVTVTSGGRSWSDATDDLGRAEFRDLPRGGDARAEATVDGERLVSEPFSVPASGGLRVILVAGIARAAERRAREQAEALAAPAVRGVVALGGNTRILAEFQGDVLRFFYQLDIVNSAKTRVDVSTPFVLELPSRAANAQISEGSPKSASLEGNRLMVAGPFNPGTTTVNLVFDLNYSGNAHTFSQTWPVAVPEWFVGVEKVNGLTVSSPQFGATEERATEQGSVFVVANGAPMAAGSALTVELANLPTQSRLAPSVAVLLALTVLGLGAWFSWSGTGTEARASLEKRRDAALVKLEDLERARRTGAISDERYGPRRERLMRDLEQIYGELDVPGVPPGGGGDQGVAA